MEIEKKFLVKELPKNIHNYKFKDIEQYYLSRIPEKRIRKMGDLYYYTEKGLGDLKRDEIEKNITEKEFRDLISHCNTRPIKKRRYFIPLDDSLTAELDIYSGSLEGLIVVEVEFDNLEKALKFNPPEWFDKNLTYEKKFKNVNLIEANSIEDLLANLSRENCFKQVITEEDRELKRKTNMNIDYDLENIIFSTSFRRMQDKTQLYYTSKGDHYRTRLTHTLEVRSISRKICKYIGLNCDLTEAIACGHDIGHTPFGHVGERVISDILSNKDDLGGLWNNIYPQYFKHNINSLRLITKIEKISNQGLNLSWQTKDGILKHTEVFKPESITKEHLSMSDPYNLNIYIEGSFLKSEEMTNVLTKKKLNQYNKLNFPLTLEGQIVSSSDEIAQRISDFEDNIRCSYLSVSLKELKRLLDINIRIVEDKMALKKYESVSVWSLTQLINETINIIETNYGEQLFTRIHSNSYMHITYYDLFVMLDDIRVKISSMVQKSEKIFYESIRDKILDSFNLVKVDNTNENFSYISNQLRLYLERDIILNSYKNIVECINSSLSGNSCNLKIIDGKKIFLSKMIDFSLPGNRVNKVFKDYNKISVINSYEIRKSDSTSSHILRQIFKAYYNNPFQLNDKTLLNIYKELEDFIKKNKSYISIDNIIKIKRRLYDSYEYSKYSQEDIQELFDYFKSVNNSHTEDNSKKSTAKEEITIRKMSKILINEIGYHIAGMTDTYAKEQYCSLYNINHY